VSLLIIFTIIMMMRILSLLVMVAATSALTVEVNNIHYGSRNIYQAASFTLHAADLTLAHHVSSPPRRQSPRMNSQPTW
jgi:hypothetical protein